MPEAAGREGRESGEAAAGDDATASRRAGSSSGGRRRSGRAPQRAAKRVGGGRLSPLQSGRGLQRAAGSRVFGGFSFSPCVLGGFLFRSFLFRAVYSRPQPPAVSNGRLQLQWRPTLVFSPWQRGKTRRAVVSGRDDPRLFSACARSRLHVIVLACQLVSAVSSSASSVSVLSCGQQRPCLVLYVLDDSRRLSVDEWDSVPSSLVGRRVRSATCTWAASCQGGMC